MRRWLVASIVAASLAWLPSFNPVAAQEVTADSFLVRAKYIAIGYGWSGGRFLTEVEDQKTMDVSKADRAALAEVRTQFEQWHRYVLTSFPEQAELLITVRAGRRGSVDGRTTIGGRQPATGFGGQVSSPDDMLSVYTTAGGGGRLLIWQKQLSKGLSGSPVPLFEQFRSAVETASKQPRP